MFIFYRYSNPSTSTVPHPVFVSIFIVEAYQLLIATVFTKLRHRVTMFECSKQSRHCNTVCYRNYVDG